MYYKAVQEGTVVDVYNGLQYVRYDERSNMFLRCEEEEAQGVIQRDGACFYQVDGWPGFPESVQDRSAGNITIMEIQEEEYKILKELLDAGQVPEEPEPEEPAVSEDTLSWAKKTKIALSKSKLAEFLEQNPIVSTAHGGIAGTYSVTEEKQQLMALNYTTYQIKKAAGIESVLTWNETGKECEIWEEAEFVQLIIEIEAYVKPRVSAQQSYEQQIQAATTLKEVDAVEIIY